MPLKKNFRFPLSLLTAAVVVFLSTYKFGEIPELADVPFVDKWTHMLMYAGLSFVVWVEYLRRNRSASMFTAIGLALVLPILLGAGMEGVQELLPYRSCDGWDIVANSIGSLLVSAVALIYLCWYKGRRL